MAVVWKLLVWEVFFESAQIKLFSRLLGIRAHLCMCLIIYRITKNLARKLPHLHMYKNVWNFLFFNNSDSKFVGISVTKLNIWVIWHDSYNSWTNFMQKNCVKMCYENAPLENNSTLCKCALSFVGCHSKMDMTRKIILHFGKNKN